MRGRTGFTPVRLFALFFPRRLQWTGRCDKVSVFEKKGCKCLKKPCFPIKAAAVYARALAKWLAVAAVTGVAGGLVGSAFYASVASATELRQAYPWLLWLLPLAGAAIALLYRLTKLDGLGTDTVIDAIHEGRGIRLLLVPVIFVSTAATHLCGGSAGREGAALQIGGGLGQNIARLFRLDDKDRRLATLCGMSALFSALFGTPLTATIFALEVISVGEVYYAGLVPCLGSALAAYGVTSLFNLAPTRFAVTAPALTADMLWRVALLGVACALMSVLLCVTMHGSEKLFKKLIPHSVLRAVLGGCAVIALTYLTGTADYNGAGTDVIAAAIEQGSARPWDFALKLVFTAVTLGCGFRGGEMVPTFFIGSTLGCVLGPLLGIPAGFAAALGLAALFCGAVNCPVASVILAVELFGSGGVVYFAVAAAIAYMLSGYSGLYRSQKIIYSKLKAEYIDIHAK